MFTAGHDRCRGVWGTTLCGCPHHTEPPPEPEPEPEPEPRGLRIGSLFSGYGGLEEGVRQVLGGTVAWHCEIDPGACKILAHRYPDVPNLGDITTVDWSAVEPVDVLTGGFPCQDVSAAGKRLGLRPDTRTGLWTQMAYAIDQLRPRLVVAENVRGLLSADAHSDLEPCPWCVGDGDGRVLRALGAVLGDLADLGYDASWHGLGACDVGAPHGRFRVFVVAWPAGADAAELGRRPARRDDGVRAARLVEGDAAGDAPVFGRDGARPAGRRGEPARAPRGSGVDASDALLERLAGAERAAEGRPATADDAGGRDEPAADSDGAGSQGREPAAGRHLSDGGSLAHATGDGRHEGRPEPARIIGGPDAAECCPTCGHLVEWHDAGGFCAGPGHDGWWCSDPEWGNGVAADTDGDAVRQQPVALAGRSGQAVTGHAGTDAPADADGDGLEGVGRIHAVGRDPDGRSGSDIAWGPYEPAIRRWERVLGRVAPPPTELSAKGSPRLSPAFVEWMQGLEPGWVTGVPGITRNEALKALGNGVVSQQCAAALRILLADVEAAA